MAKYLYTANLTPAGLKGTLKEGGSARRDAVAKAVESLGGTLEFFCYAFGDNDIYGIIDVPDNVHAAAFSLHLTAAGGGTVETRVLITPEELDAVAEKTADYQPPKG